MNCRSSCLRVPSPEGGQWTRWAEGGPWAGAGAGRAEGRVCPDCAVGDWGPSGAAAAGQRGRAASDDHPRALLHVRQGEVSFRAAGGQTGARVQSACAAPATDRRRARPPHRPPARPALLVFPWVQVIGNKWLTYIELLQNGNSESDAFVKLNLKRYCAFARPRPALRLRSCAARLRAGCRLTLPAGGLRSRPPPFITAPASCVPRLPANAHDARGLD
jgi:hypothetical protein